MGTAMVAADDNPLSPHYYRDNFLRLCDTVEAQYGDIFTEAEQQALQGFRALPFAGQCLYVRLISRTGPWFRESKLKYPEIASLQGALEELVQQGVLAVAAELTLDELAKLYTRAELQTIFARHLPAGTPTNKNALLQAIRLLSKSDKELFAAISALDGGRVVAPLGRDLVEKLQLLFLGNRPQSLTDFVLQDLGVARYFPYPLDRQHRLFSCRAAVEEYLALAALSDSHYELLEQGEMASLAALAQQVLAQSPQFSSSEDRWPKLCNRLARDLERLHAWDLALQLYAASGRHPARERQARIFEQLGQWSQADALCEEIRANPWCEAEQEAASRIQPRVKRKLGIKPAARKNDSFAELHLSLCSGSGPVEQQTARYLQDQWHSVHYVENSLMSSLFGLAFWEQIFTVIPGAFNNPFQAAPTDMYDPAFRHRRLSQIEGRLQQLRTVDLATELHKAYDRYRHYQSRWVNWKHIPAELVHTAASIIPAAHLLAIWERMLFDPGQNRRGFPDLIALGAARGDYCMIEVKGPGDALQDSQKQWLRFFQRLDIPAAVAWVNWKND